MNPIQVIDERIRRKLAGIRQAFRGVVTLVNAAGAVQLVQGTGLSGETLQGMELFQHFGLTSNPPKDSMFVVVPLGGKTAHGIVIATEHGSYRLKNLASGEMAIYNDLGMKVHLAHAGIVVDGGGKPLTVQNVSDANVTCTGKAVVSASEIDLVGTGGTAKGIVQGDCICPLTGQPHGMVSTKIKGSL